MLFITTKIPTYIYKRRNLWFFRCCLLLKPVHMLIRRNANVSMCLYVIFSKWKFAPTDEREVSLRSLKGITDNYLTWSFPKCNYQTLLKTKQASCPSCPRTSLLQCWVSRVICTYRCCDKLYLSFLAIFLCKWLAPFLYMVAFLMKSSNVTLLFHMCD